MLLLIKRRRRSSSTPFVGLLARYHGVARNVIHEFLSNARCNCGMMAASYDNGGELRFVTVCQFVDEFQIRVASCLGVVLAFARRRIRHDHFPQLSNGRDRLKRCTTINRADANRRRVVTNVRYHSILRRVDPDDTTARVGVTFVVVRRFRNSNEDRSKGERVEVVLQINRELSQHVSNGGLTNEHANLFRHLGIRVGDAFVARRLRFSNRFICAYEGARTTYRKGGRSVATIHVNYANLPRPFQDGQEATRITVLIRASVFNGPYGRLRQVNGMDLALLFKRYFLGRSFMQDGRFITRAQVARGSTRVVNVNTRV